MARRNGRLGWWLCVAWAVASVASMGALADDRDWHSWRLLPVQDGGRIKPFDSLARDTLRKMTGRESIRDPDTGEQLEPVAAYLSLVFAWQGWDGPTRSAAAHAERPASPYFGRHTGDSWDQMPLLPVPHADLRELLSLPRGSRAIAPYALSQAKIEVPESHEQRPFVTWAERLGQKEVDQRTTLERHAWELMQRYWEYQRHRMGDRLLVVPSRDGTRSRWLSLHAIVSGSFDEKSDPTGKLRVVQQSFAAARQSRHDASHEVQSAPWESLRQALSELSELDESVPQPTSLRWEVWSNRWLPFRWSWICLLLAAMWLAFGAWTERRWCDRCGWILYATGCLAMCVGIAVRVFVSGRWLGANMYESVVLVGGEVTLLGLLGSLIARDRICLFAGASVGALVFAFIDPWVGVVDPSLQPLPLAQQYTLWFVVYGLSMTMGFAFLALNAAISNVQLGLLLGRNASRAGGQHTHLLMQRTADWGTLWLAAGLITGALWAERAWGRFWSWDPKETWALIALLAYLAAQHARSARWLQTYGTAAIHTVCFQLVIVAFLGVNCLEHSGRNDSGFVEAPGWMIAVMAIQCVVVVATGVRVAWQAHQAREERRLGMQP